MIHLVTFCDERMTISAEKLKESAYKNGMDDVLIYERNNLPVTFVQMAKPTIDVPKGAGLYIWKPFVILEYMSRISDGDILIYADAGQTFVSNVRPVIDAMDRDVMLFSNGWQHVDWCKMSVFESILGNIYYTMRDMFGSNPMYSLYKQAQASLIFFKVSPESRDFVKTWMLYCLMPGFCDDSPSKIENVQTFAETRWDQSVLTCLGIRENYPLRWFPSLTNMHNKADHPKDNYTAIVDHHRRRNPGATGGTDSEW